MGEGDTLGDHPAHARALHLVAEPDIAVVVADDAESARRLRLDQLDRPQRQLRAQAHDQQQRRHRFVAEILVLKRDSIRLEPRHGFPAPSLWKFTVL